MLWRDSNPKTRSTKPLRNWKADKPFYVSLAFPMSFKAAVLLFSFTLRYLEYLGPPGLRRMTPKTEIRIKIVGHSSDEQLVRSLLNHLRILNAIMLEIIEKHRS